MHIYQILQIGGPTIDDTVGIHLKVVTDQGIRFERVQEFIYLGILVTGRKNKKSR